MSDERIDPKPALGTPASPAFGEKTGEKVALHIGEWRDGRWSYLYGDDTGYRGAGGRPRGRARGGAHAPARASCPKIIQGPIINPPVWTWEVPLYFWFGGIAAGSSFVALACDLVGDERSAAVARKVALGALGPSPVLLILDLGRPERFVNMLRIFKPRSPMSMGAWALTLFGNLAAAAVGADLLGRRRLAQRLGAANALVGGYLGSYTGVLLASTAVPVWARSRLFLGPIFVSTAAATGAAACRLALVADGLPVGSPDAQCARHRRDRRDDGGAAAVDRQRAQARRARRRGSPRAGRAGCSSSPNGRCASGWRCASRAAAGRGCHHAASVLYLAAGLAFRYAWVGAGRRSARHDAVVAQMARERKSGS